jgi:hypothetical protein
MAFLDRLPEFALMSVTVAVAVPLSYPFVQWGALSLEEFPPAGVAFLTLGVLIPPLIWIATIRRGVQRFGRRGWWLLLAAPIALSIWVGLASTYF